MKRLPPLKSLQGFRHAAEALSFKQAAEQLHVTPTAISQQIKALESVLGLSLFRRKTREVVLTPEGQQLLSYVSKAFRLLEEGVSRLEEDPNPERLVLSSIPSFSARFLIPRLGRFQAAEKSLSIHLQPSLALANFEGSDLDVSVRFGTGDYPGLTARHLMDDYIIPVCHPSLLSDDQPIEKRLRELPVLVDDSKDIDPLWRLFQDKTGIRNRHAESRFRVSDANLLLEAVLGAQGLSLLRYSLVYEHIENGILSCPLPVYLTSPYQFFLVAPALHFNRPKVKRFEAWLRQEMKAIEASWKAFHAQYLDHVSPLNLRENAAAGPDEYQE